MSSLKKTEGKRKTKKEEGKEPSKLNKYTKNKQIIQTY